VFTAPLARRFRGESLQEDHGPRSSSSSGGSLLLRQSRSSESRGGSPDTWARGSHGRVGAPLGAEELALGSSSDARDTLNPRARARRTRVSTRSRTTGPSRRSVARSIGWSTLTRSAPPATSPAAPAREL